MEKRTRIKNPFDPEQNHCFGCGPANNIGLKLSFEESEKYLHASWEPDMQFQGYNNVLHGGIIAALLDEIGAWCIYVKAGTAAVTSTMNVSYIKPAFMSKGTFALDASIITREKNKATIACRLFDNDKILCAEAEIKYFTYPEHIARKKFYYPGREAFYFEKDNGGTQ